ncbi:ATP-dependent DNA helicase MPH1 [Podospora australis]|uniref:ATP-dependent DNA helicase n=1 Tax=Podospora australis TaxID=1536484 RepID=A0AAN7AH30_9PEZI|nr:ATP-dependent DNA helicase MPH1 [Podospora australis]
MDDDEFDDGFDDSELLALTQAAEAAAFKDLPSDAFDSSPEITRPCPRPLQQQNLRQTTLWGSTTREDRQQPSHATNSRPFRADIPPEVPTHHELDHDELSTWVYPLNLGPIRDYQFNIVSHGLFNNTLVALPTGLGKTFIAATVMLNFFRWTKNGKIIFVAPTKPLVSQQVKACLEIAGVPRSQATLLTGETAPVLREGEWERKRLFFMTPQTLMNDLSKGYADPKSIVLLVVDEAHRSTGDYAYVKVIEFIRRFSQSFRVLALTATPGSTVEGVQDVINNLGISHVEIRTEESLDIRQYVHSRNIDTVTFDPSDEMLQVKDLFSKALKPLVDKLSAQNIYWGRDPMSLTTYGLMQTRNEWLKGPGRTVNQGLKFAMFAVFSVLQSLAHSIKLLNFHGIKPFYSNLAEFRNSEEEKGVQGSKNKKKILQDENFQKMMSMVEGWIRSDEFSGHPKLNYLCETLVNHFIDAGEGSNTRAIVFSEYRDSAEEIVRLLNTKPLISATVFVGQADSKRSEGMKQKQQIETIEKFKNGQYNVLVATSIGEEGLDIGQVDLIICYDASSSPIRMLQRMGRTGRKRAGNIVLLLMKGKEEDKFREAQDNYQKMQELICSGDRFQFRHDLSTRIIPRNIKPEVDKRLVEIPIENTQDTSLPEPRKSAAALRKKPAKKKFHMPDGVETGFIKASFFGKASARKVSKPSETDFLAEIPDLNKTLLSDLQNRELEKRYRSLPSRPDGVVHLNPVNLQAYKQRALSQTEKLKHGRYTKRCIKTFRRLGELQSTDDDFAAPYGLTDTSEWQQIAVKPFAEDSDQAAKSPLGDERVQTDRATSRKRKVPTSFSADSSKEGDTQAQEEEDASLNRTKSKPRARQSRGRGKKAGAQVARRLEEMGDDCMRTSDLEETDGSDDGADLVGFVVDDNAALTSSAQLDPSSPTTPCTPGLTLRHKAQRATKENPFFEPVEFDATQETDEEIPDIAELAARSTSAKKRKQTAYAIRDSEGGEEDDEDEDPSPQPTPRKAKRRRQLIPDSDDD